MLAFWSPTHKAHNPLTKCRLDWYTLFPRPRPRVQGHGSQGSLFHTGCVDLISRSPRWIARNLPVSKQKYCMNRELGKSAVGQERVTISRLDISVYLTLAMNIFYPACDLAHNSPNLQNRTLVVGEIRNRLRW